MTRDRRRTAAAVAVTLALAGSVLAAQKRESADQLVARNIAAKGGLEKLKSIQTIKTTSIVNANGQEMPLTVYGRRPNLIRQEISINKQLVVSAFDGQVAWILNPLLGPQQSKPIVMAGPQSEQIKADSAFDGPLVDYRGQGYTAAVDDLETVDGVEQAHIRLTATSGRVIHIYLNNKTGLDVRHVTVTNQVRLEQHFDDYRAVDGYTVPFRIRTLVNGVQQSEVRVQQVEFNMTVDDALFKLPK